MSERKYFNRDIIKFFAIITMFLNHFAHMFLQNGTFIYELFVNIGYFTAITMCYFLVEGFNYTRSKSKYALRLLVFAIFSQIPFMFALGEIKFNTLFSLLWGFCFIWLEEINTDFFVKNLMRTVLVGLCIFSDWSVFSVIFIWMFYKGVNNKNIKQAYIKCLMIYYIMKLYDNGIKAGFPDAVVISLFNTAGLVLSAVVIIYLYNGKKSERFNKLAKWFFYLFYPLHLVFLLLIRFLFAYI